MTLLVLLPIGETSPLVTAGAALAGALVGGLTTAFVEWGRWKREDRFRWAEPRRHSYGELYRGVQGVVDRGSAFINLIQLPEIPRDEAIAHLDSVHEGLTETRRLLFEVALLGEDKVNEAVQNIATILEAQANILGGAAYLVPRPVAEEAEGVEGDGETPGAGEGGDEPEGDSSEVPTEAEIEELRAKVDAVWSTSLEKWNEVIDYFVLAAREELRIKKHRSLRRANAAGDEETPDLSQEAPPASF